MFGTRADFASAPLLASDEGLPLGSGGWRIEISDCAFNRGESELWRSFNRQADHASRLLRT